MSGQFEQSETLDSILPIPRSTKSVPLGYMIMMMQTTGFHKLGFVIYRCAYSDEAVWERYVQHMRHGPGADDIRMKNRIPRFSYCVMVDQKCLDMLKKYEEWQVAGGRGNVPYVPCILVDAKCGSEGKGRNRFSVRGGLYERLDGRMSMLGA
ncbi:hypothetical protein PT974_10492 [Cladobotryum mycophilum]|uniref:Uncharacterized protein n=1 Tax=Cladobotryum mycophilum TaxID=491253 RepID=A0ABR0SA06_9HYPO